MEIKQSLPSKLRQTLIALACAVFFSVAGVSSVLSLYAQLSNRWTARPYVAVPATVLSVEPESHAGGPVKASFAYEYLGRDYRSTRVGKSSRGNDVYDFQRDICAKLQQAHADGTQVRMWVDPDRPEQAVFDRGIRPHLMAVEFPFAILCPPLGAVGWFALWMIWGGQRRPARLHGEGPPAIPAERGDLLITGMAVAYYNIAVWPAIMLVWFGDLSEVSGLDWFGLGFPLLGGFLLYKMGRHLRQRWHIGKPVVEVVRPWAAGSPLQGRIRFVPGLGTRLAPDQLMHRVTLEARLTEESLVPETGPEESAISRTLWEQCVVDTVLARGTETVDFSVALPMPMPEPRMLARGPAYVTWQLVLKTANAEAIFELPPLGIPGAI